MSKKQVLRFAALLAAASRGATGLSFRAHNGGRQEPQFAFDTPLTGADPFSEGLFAIAGLDDIETVTADEFGGGVDYEPTAIPARDDEAARVADDYLIPDEPARDTPSKPPPSRKFSWSFYLTQMLVTAVEESLRPRMIPEDFLEQRARGEKEVEDLKLKTDAPSIKWDNSVMPIFDSLFTAAVARGDLPSCASKPGKRKCTSRWNDAGAHRVGGGSGPVSKHGGFETGVRRGWVNNGDRRLIARRAAVIAALQEAKGTREKRWDLLLQTSRRRKGDALMTSGAPEPDSKRPRATTPSVLSLTGVTDADFAELATPEFWWDDAELSDLLLAEIGNDATLVDTTTEGARPGKRQHDGKALSPSNVWQPWKDTRMGKDAAQTVREAREALVRADESRGVLTHTGLRAFLARNDPAWAAHQGVHCDGC